MALSAGDITRAWKSWLLAVLSDSRPCQWNKEEMAQVVSAVDAWVEANSSSFNSTLPAFIRTGARAASADEKAAMLAAVVIMRMTPEFRRNLLESIE